MLTISDFARQYWPRGLNDVSNSSERLVEWISSMDYEVHDEIDDEDSFSLSNFSKSFIKVNAFEIERMACASLETHLALDRTLKGKKNLAWMVIKLYYSAYYAAHAVMRSMGRLCIHLDHQATNMVFRYARTYHPNSLRPKTGNYLVEYNADLDCVEFTRSGISGGAHVFFWDEFKKLIDYLLNELGNKPAAYQNVLVSLSDLKDCLAMEGNNQGNWLSMIRNNVAYKHEYGVWYPFKNFEKSDSFRLFKNIRLDIDPLGVSLRTSNSRWYRFSSITNYIIVLMIEIGNDLINRNSVNKSFLKKNYGHLLGKTKKSPLYQS